MYNIVFKIIKSEIGYFKLFSHFTIYDGITSTIFRLYQMFRLLQLDFVSKYNLDKMQRHSVYKRLVFCFSKIQFFPGLVNPFEYTFLK